MEHFPDVKIAFKNMLHVQKNWKYNYLQHYVFLRWYDCTSKIAEISEAFYTKWKKLLLIQQP